MGVGILAIEAKGHPSMTCDGQFEVPLRFWRHPRRIKNEKLLPFLVADPELRFIGCEPCPMGSMANWLLTCDDAMQNLSLFQVHHVKAHGLSQTHIRDRVGAVYGVRKNSVLAHVLHLLDD